MRYLIDRQIKGALRIHGEPRTARRRRRGRVLIFDNPEIEPATAHPRLTVLSLDIETDPRTNRLLRSRSRARARKRCCCSRSASRADVGAPRRARRRRRRGRRDRARRRPPLRQRSGPGARVRAAHARDRPRRHHRLERDRLRPRLPAGARRSARHPVRDRSRPGRDAPLLDARSLQRRRLTTRRRSRGASSSTASGSCAAPSSAWRATRSTSCRARWWAKARPSKGAIASPRSCAPGRTTARRSSATTCATPRLVLEILDKLDLVPLAVERTLLTGMPPDRVSASVASFDFLYLSELSKRGLAAPSVGAYGAESDVFGGTVLAARGRPLRQRAGVRLQEPLPLDHPHLRDRSAGLPGLGPGRIRERGGRAQRRRVPSPQGHPQRSARSPVRAARGGQAARRQGGELRHQDPDELVLRRARHAGVPLLQSQAGGGDHQLRPRDPAVVEGPDGGAGPRRPLRRHRQPVRALRDRRPGGGAGARRASWRRSSTPSSSATCARPGASSRGSSSSSSGSTCASSSRASAAAKAAR